MNDIYLPAVTVIHAGGVSAPAQRTPAAEPAQPVSAATPLANPTLRLDAALGLVVIEFHNESGAITNSIPSQRQLEEYQRWETTKIGPMPLGGPELQQTALIPAATATTEQQPVADGDVEPSRPNSAAVHPNSGG